MIILKAKKEDVEQIMVMVNGAKAYLRNCGVDQWQNGYPDESTYLNAIKEDCLYVLKEDDVKAVFVLRDYEDTYEVIDGKWLRNDPYVVIHSICVKERQKGYASAVFRMLQEKYPDIRIDTHKDNVAMNTALKKNGFVYCGVIKLHDGSFRNAYEFVKGE